MNDGTDESGRLERQAAELRQRLIRDGAGSPDEARTLGQTLGQALVGQHRFDTAVGLLETATDCFPDDPPLYYWLSRAYRFVNRFDDAIEALARSVALAPDNLALRRELVTAYQDAGRREAVVAECRSLVSQPDLQPPGPGPAWAFRAWFGACWMLGRHEEARAVLDEGLTHHPRDAWLLYQRTILEPCTPAHPVFGLLHDMAVGEDWAGEDEAEGRAAAWFALARMHEEAGDHAEAFAAARRANEWVARRWAGKGRAFDRQRHAAEVSAIIDRYDIGFLGARTGLGAAAIEHPPVPILGVSRSGKSLLANLLAAHPQLVNLDERRDLGRLLAECGEAIAGPPGDKAVAAAAQRLGQGYAQSLAQAAGPGVQALDTHPYNLFVLGALGVALPGTRAIFVERDPRDLLAANFFTFHAGQNYSCDPQDCRAYIRDYLRLMRHWQRVEPVAIHTVHYEDLVCDPDRVIGETLAFLGLEWDDACRTDVAEVDLPTVQNPVDSLAVRTRPDPAQIGYWRRYAEWLPDIGVV